MNVSNLELPDIYHSTPLQALRMASRKKLSGFLDIEGILVVCGQVDVVNDFTGLAEIVGFSSQNILNMKRQKSPTTEFLEQWTGRSSATIGILWQLISFLERFDVLTDCRACIIRDCEAYDEQQTRERDARLEGDCGTYDEQQKRERDAHLVRDCEAYDEQQTRERDAHLVRDCETYDEQPTRERDAHLVRDCEAYDEQQTRERDAHLVRDCEAYDEQQTRERDAHLEGDCGTYDEQQTRERDARLIRDCEAYDEQQTHERDARLNNVEQDPTVSKRDKLLVVDETICTTDDVRTGRTTYYDAFICYTQEDDDDRKFVHELIGVLEQDLKLKLFVPGRNDLPGGAEHTLNAYIIEKRCRRIVLLISRKFLESEACDFQLKFAHALSPGARRKKLIPIIREKNILVPRILLCHVVVDLSKSDMLEWSWNRIHKAIIAPPIEADNQTNQSDLDESLKHIAYPTNRRMDENEDQSEYNALLAEAGTTGSDVLYMRTRSEPMGHEVYSSQPSTSMLSDSQGAIGGVSMSAKNGKKNTSTCSKPSQSQTPTRGNLTSERAIARPKQQKPVPLRKPASRRNVLV